MDERIITSDLLEEDSDEMTIRPQSLREYIGQNDVKENMNIFIQSALIRKKPLDHVLLYGPPGLGKTTLAYIIANELGSNVKTASGPSIEKSGDLAAILSTLEENDVLFIDEIHRLNHSVEEILYPAMEDYALDFIVGKGPSARNMRLKIQPFTLIGATTKAGSISSPLRDRFGVLARLELYSTEELATIVERSAGILNIAIDKDAVTEIGKRSRGTPRIANRLLKRVRDYAEVKGDGKITLEIAKYALKLMEIDELGLDFIDRRILSNILNKFSGGPVGLDTLAAATGEEAGTIEDVYEPYLIQLGFIARTPRGRIALAPAYKHMNVTLSEDKEKQLNSLQKGLADTND